LLFLFVGNISKWIYYGGEKSFDEVGKENNYTIGLVISIVLGFLIFFSFA
jgi:hypothetical protein